MKVNHGHSDNCTRLSRQWGKFWNVAICIINSVHVKTRENLPTSLVNADLICVNFPVTKGQFILKKKMFFYIVPKTNWKLLPKYARAEIWDSKLVVWENWRHQRDILKLTLLGLGLIKINDVSANFNNPRPSLTLNN